MDVEEPLGIIVCHSAPAKVKRTGGLYRVQCSSLDTVVRHSVLHISMEYPGNVPVLNYNPTSSG